MAEGGTGDFPAQAFLAELDEILAPADAQAAAFPGDPARRQPVHTAYVPADRYEAGTPRHWGEQALALLGEHAPTPARLAGITDLPAAFADEVHARVRAKLATGPVEDLRVDFEDGYPPRSGDDEDRDAVATGRHLAAGAATATGGPDAPAGPEVPLLSGIRIKSLDPGTRHRGLRTLGLVTRAAVEAGGLPGRFVVTLPKVTHPAQVHAAVRVCEHLESTLGLTAGALRFELQVELPQAVVGPDGAATVARLVHAAAGRCEGLHYGTYDFSAAAGVVALEQSLEHPLADHAKAVMQLAAAQTGVRVSDGSTNVIPEGNRDSVVHAWRLHARLVDRALRRGLYQGWDLHPGHLVTRYAATYSFYRAQLRPSCARLADHLARSSHGRDTPHDTPATVLDEPATVLDEPATVLDEPATVLDEPATVLALAGVVLRALDCGATDDDEVRRLSGLERARLLVLARRRPGT